MPRVKFASESIAINTIANLGNNLVPGDVQSKRGAYAPVTNDNIKAAQDHKDGASHIPARTQLTTYPFQCPPTDRPQSYTWYMLFDCFHLLRRPGIVQQLAGQVNTRKLNNYTGTRPEISMISTEWTKCPPLTMCSPSNWCHIWSMSGSIVPLPGNFDSRLQVYMYV